MNKNKQKNSIKNPVVGQKYPSLVLNFYMKSVYAREVEGLLDKLFLRCGVLNY